MYNSEVQIKKCVFNVFISVLYSDFIGVPPRGGPVQVDYVFKIIGAHFVCEESVSGIKMACKVSVFLLVNQICTAGALVVITAQGVYTPLTHPVCHPTFCSEAHQPIPTAC